MKRCLIPTDRQKMIQFISSQLPDGEGRLTLAYGVGSGEDIIADITVLGDDLDIQSNCPEWVTVREVYEHLHWRSMPHCEQQAWIRAESLAFHVADLQNRLEAFDVIANKSPFRFQKVNRLWVVYFTVADRTRIGIFNDHRGFQHLAMLLANQDRCIDSIQLDGRTDPDTMQIITSERQQRAEKRCGGSLTTAMLRDSLEALHQKYTTARERDDRDGMNDAEDEIARFKKQIGTDEKDFERYVLQKETPKTLERTIHRTVSMNLRRAYEIFRENVTIGEDMRECADFLELHIQPEGYGFAYRPPSHFRPEWLL